MGIWYCTREEVRLALDTKEAAHNDTQIDRAIESASRNIEGLCKRKFAPVQATRRFPWPDPQGSRAYRLWLDENELISVTTLTSGGESLTENTDYFLEPVNSGPPFRYVEMNLAGSGAFSSGDSFQRSIVITGLFGYNDEQAPAGELVEALDSSETEVQVSDSSLISVGHLLTVGSERMRVTERDALDIAQNTQGALTAAKNDTTVAVEDGTDIHPGEILLVEGERMKVVSVAGNNVTVLRAFDGTPLAAHSSGTDIYALRSLTVERGAQGSTAATHSSADPITKWVVPGGINALCVAEAVVTNLQEAAGYGNRIGTDMAERDSSGSENMAGRGLPHLRRETKTAYGRKFRKRAV